MEISNTMVRLYEEQVGRGPTMARTYWSGPDMLASRPGVCRHRAGNQDHRSAAGELLHLALMPVAGVGQRDRGCVGDPGRGKLMLGGGDHRSEMPEVR